MSALTFEPDLIGDRTAARVTTPSRTLPGRARPQRPGRGTGRATGPQLRPGRGVAAPSLRPHRTALPSSCAVSAPARAGGWQLTDRGIAAILVALTVITVAAVMVVGLTALRVTSPTYQAYGQSQLSQP